MKGGADSASDSQNFIVADYPYHLGSVWALPVAYPRFGRHSRYIVGNGAYRGGSAVLQSGRNIRRRVTDNCISNQSIRYSRLAAWLTGKLGGINYALREFVMS